MESVQQPHNRGSSWEIPGENEEFPSAIVYLAGKDATSKLFDKPIKNADALQHYVYNPNPRRPLRGGRPCVLLRHEDLIAYP